MWRRQSGWSRIILHLIFAQCVGSTILDGSFMVKGRADVRAGRVRGGEGGRDDEKEPDVEELEE
jgi:hypothetical protein